MQWLHSYCLHSLFISHVDTVNTKGNAYIKGHSGFIWFVYFLCRHSRYKTLTHIFAHNFLNIEPIFNLKKFGKLRLRAFQPCHQILCMLILSMQVIRISNAFNAMYVKAVDTFCTQYTHM